jgi:hypothetical protein
MGLSIDHSRSRECFHEREELEEFWGKQDFVRSLIVLDNLVSLPQTPQYKEYGRAWSGAIRRALAGVLFQTHYLMNLGGVDVALTSFLLGAILK